MLGDYAVRAATDQCSPPARTCPPLRRGRAVEPDFGQIDQGLVVFAVRSRHNDHRPHPDDVQEARRAEAGGDARTGPSGRRGRGSTTRWSRRWRGRSGGGRCWTRACTATLEDLAKAKGFAPSYVSRILRLTLLAPEIVEAILDGRQPAELQLDDLLEGFPLEWSRQSNKIGNPLPKGATDDDWPSRSCRASDTHGSRGIRVSLSRTT